LIKLQNLNQKKCDYTEEVEELRSMASDVLESLEDINESRIFQEYRDKHHLSEINFSQEDISEVFYQLIHICNVVLNGQKILFVSSRFVDSAMIEG
jgi:predicted ribosome quality control (RQC) complex YloA/Tae2 family protein